MCTELCLQEMLSDILKGVPIWMFSSSMSADLLNMTETSMLMEAGLVLNEHKCLFRMFTCFKEGQRITGDSMLPGQEHSPEAPPHMILPFWAFFWTWFLKSFFSELCNHCGAPMCACTSTAAEWLGWVLSFHKYSTMLPRTQWLLLLTHWLKHSESSHCKWTELQISYFYYVIHIREIIVEVFIVHTHRTDKRVLKMWEWVRGGDCQMKESTVSLKRKA